MIQTFENTINKTLNNGFLLTRQSRDRADKIEIVLWVKTVNGPVKIVVSDELAVMFVQTIDLQRTKDILSQFNVPFHHNQSLALKTFEQQAVTAFYFSTSKHFYAARERLKTNGIRCFEDDIRPDDRFLMERFITANIDFVGDVVSKKGYVEVQQVKCKSDIKITKDINLNMVSLDIECSMQGELYSIGLYSENQQCVFMIGDGELGIHQKAKSYLHWVKDEKQLLEQLMLWFVIHDPDIIIGWNVINFDMALLQKRCDLHKLDFSIGRDLSNPYWRTNNNSGQKYLEIAGRVVLDGIDLLKTATYSFASFSLDNVSRELLGLHKKVDDVDNRVAEITDNFHHNKLELAAYNLEDCRLVWLIFEKTQLLSFAILRAQLTGLEIDRIGGSVAAFTNLYLPKLHRSGYVAPNLGDGESELVSPGGYVMDSIPGLYENILVLDFKSLYPSIIRTFNIDPMGLIEGLSNPETAIEGFDGAYFSRDKHFLPEIIKNLWAERDKAKRDKNAALSQAIKIIMNSFYGVLGSTGCRFFDPRLSGSITKRSHQLLKTTKKWIEDKGYRVIYGDTDSIFVHIAQISDAQRCKEIGGQLQNFINDKLQLELREKYQVTSELEIEFETHFTKFLMPTIRGLDVGTKKRYAGLVEKDGKQHIVFKGLESVRTDWTELSKVFQKELYHRVFNGLPIKDYVKEMVFKTSDGQFDDLLIYRKRIRRKLDEYIKNVPPHIRAARQADDINFAEGKTLKYQNKGWIEYLMTVNGPQAKEHLDAKLDYQLYIDRQLAPIADAILPFVGTSFSEIVDAQLNLFS